MSRIVSAINLGLGLVPWGLLCLLVLEAISVRLELGHRPVPYRDPWPDSWTIDQLEELVFWTGLTTVYTAPVWALTLAGGWRDGGRKRVVRRMVIYVGAVALLWLFALVDPLGFMAWWID